MAAFALAEILIDGRGPLQTAEWRVLPVILPIWILTAKLYGLYDRDEERADHTTVDDLVGVFHLVTLGSWLLLIAGRGPAPADPELIEARRFWLLAIVLVTGRPGVARSLCRQRRSTSRTRSSSAPATSGSSSRASCCSTRSTGSTLVGFVDGEPRERAPRSRTCRFSGRPTGLPTSCGMFDVDRVVVAFSREPDAGDARGDPLAPGARRPGRRRAPAVRHRRPEGRHATRSRACPSSASRRCGRRARARAAKRAIDVVGASVAARRDGPAARRDRARGSGSTRDGPVLFRQTRLGMGMREFTALKFRTMRVGTTPARTARTSSRTMARTRRWRRTASSSSTAPTP